MDEGKAVEVEVAYAKIDAQRILAIHVAAGTPARELVRQSGLAEYFPEIDAETCPIGLFGARIDDNYGVQAGDRIEIYRPLERDPREARRELAARGLTISSVSGVK
jgi:putative ubiquitin-RnfH superfamily antitoxin RatB of RatAB toxin-antitoxin module